MLRICIALADADRARIYTYEQLHEVEQLREERALVPPAPIASPSYALEDYREAHLIEPETSLAQEILDELARMTRDQGYRDVVLIASPRILAELHGDLEALRRVGVTIDELDDDFMTLSTTELRDRLATLGLLPLHPPVAIAPT